MAVAPTGAIYKALKFDNVSSRTYGVYITGEAVYNAPERDVEMITIPGRNGSFALDNGRFENIEVSYPAGIFAETEADFREAISDFRNFLCSRNGYVRLQDEYNPDEYRMAVYKSGLEVTPAMLKAGEFTITFDCKPQRWLTSGETEVTIASSGDTITNPTLFESSPLLKVKGAGEIAINGESIVVGSLYVGTVKVGGGGDNTYNPQTISLDTSLLNIGDPIYTDGMSSGYTPQRVTCEYDLVTTIKASSFVITSGSGVASIVGYVIRLTIQPDYSTGFVFGTASSYTSTVTAEATIDNTTVPVTFEYTVSYDGADTITLTRSVTYSSPYISRWYPWYNEIPIWYAESTQLANPDPLYIDLEIGEAYGEESGTILSFNDYVTIPTSLPVLSSGSNTITYDNTITSLKVVPRWWKV